MARSGLFRERYYYQPAIQRPISLLFPEGPREQRPIFPQVEARGWANAEKTDEFSQMGIPVCCFPGCGRTLWPDVSDQPCTPLFDSYIPIATAISRLLDHLKNHGIDLTGIILNNDSPVPLNQLLAPHGVIVFQINGKGRK